MTIAERFTEVATAFPEKCFLVETDGPGASLTYGDVLRRARGFARHLADHAVVAGDRVILHCPNSVDYVCAYFGIWLAGATVVPLDHRTRAARVAEVCRDAGARCLVTPSVAPPISPDIAHTSLGEVDWDSGGQAAPIPHNELALIIYTSGTTGTPKGVCLSQRNIEHTRQAITEWAQVTGEDRELTTLSLTHLFGLAHLHVYAALGARMYIAEGLRDVPRLLQTISGERITSFPGTPAGFQLLLDRFAGPFGEHARRLRYIVVNTAPMPAAYTRRLLSLLPDTRVYMYYGLTEASRSTYIAYRNHPDKLETVGRPSPGEYVCIASDAEPAIGTPGEILVKGPHVTSGYWGRPSTDDFDEGWFRTGDLGQVDSDGFLTWLGRVREQINVDGLKLVPSEVEDVLRQDPRVQDCAVVGAPDRLTGESVVAFVVLREPGDAGLELQLRRLCAAHLEPHKVPRRIRFVDTIPKTDSGKVMRLALREQVSER